MERAPFIIFKRKDREGKTYFCARFVEQGQVIKTATLREAKTPTHAARIAAKMLADGVVGSKENPRALDYLAAFWSPESDYVRGRALRGVVLSEKHIAESWKIIARHGKPFLQNVNMADISPELLERMVLALNKEGLGARSINVLLQAIKTAFRYYARLHKLANPLPSVQKLREDPKERGILTIAELQSILALTEESPRVLASIALGAFCGLRLGEIRGLQVGDWRDGLLTVSHNIVSEGEGLKRPKWQKIRTVPMPAFVADLLALVQDMPQPGGKYAIFNQSRAGAPIEAVSITKGFHRCLEKIGITEEQRKARNLTFHGLRHFFITYSRSLGIPDHLVMRMSGHSDMAMTDQYSDHDNVVDFAAAREKIEKGIADQVKKALGALT